MQTHTLHQIEQRLTERALKHMSADRICRLGGPERIKKTAMMIFTRKNVKVSEGLASVT